MTTFIPSPEQTRIIEHPLTPVRVAAGAGTGKTTTIAHRIGRLIAGGIDPERVLGITFTNKAADELATRVREVLGDAVDPGRDVEVHTYHGFAAHILHEFGPLVGVERGTGVITPTFARQLFHDSLAGDFELLDVTWTGHLDRAVQLAGVLSDNLLDVEQLVTSAPTDPDDVWRTRLEYAAIVAGYEAEKRRLGVVDFGDLIARAQHLVLHYPDFARRIRDRYQAVLLDEYQDTNPAQRELLRGLFGDGFPVMAVGDADQTIYEWRGASLQNFEGFPEHFPDADGRPAVTLPLSLNRRSGQDILEFANRIRAQVTGAGVRPDLHALDEAAPGQVTVRWLGTAVEEAEFIADQIRDLHDSGTPWRDMAVLFRKNKDIETVRASLEAGDIPVEVANLGGLLDIPEVADIYAWLRVLEDPSDTPALLRLLMNSTYRLGMGDLKPLADWTAGEAADPDHPRVPRRSMTEALDHLDSFESLSSRAVDALESFRNLYVGFVLVAQGVNLVELVRTILSETGAWPEIEAMPEAARMSARLNLYRFLDLAEEWSPLEGRPSLSSFVAHLALMAEDQTEELDTARLSGEDAVALMTIHRAKGLEWDAVFLPASYRGNFPMTGGTMDDPFRHAYLLPYDLRLDSASLPPISAEMSDKDRADLLRENGLDQEWRIAYVATTRARHKLTVSGAFWYG
ncbi:MAG: ATP-dependent helicase, partial [Acidimicrobiia bacterium]|nr:ATP-dependent helicase [Acidimicrobiia bacterium]